MNYDNNIMDTVSYKISENIKEWEDTIKGLSWFPQWLFLDININQIKNKKTEVCINIVTDDFSVILVMLTYYIVEGSLLADIESLNINIRRMKIENLHTVLCLVFTSENIRNCINQELKKNKNDMAWQATVKLGKTRSKVTTHLCHLVESSEKWE